MDEKNTNTEVTVEVQGADNLEVSIEELPAEAETRGKLNVGAVAVTGLVIGGIVYGITKAVKIVKNVKRRKSAEQEEDDYVEEHCCDAIDEEEEVEEQPEPKQKKKSSKKKVEDQPEVEKTE